MSTELTPQTFFYVERLGSQIIRTGSCYAPQFSDIAGSHPDSIMEQVAPEHAGVPLPAYWTDQGYPVTAGLQPTAAHRFDYTLLKWVVDEDQAWGLVRSKRDTLIAATDWRATRSIVEKRRLHPAWAGYRNALRDVTLQPNPDDITWPVVPTAPTFADEDPDEYPVFEGNSKFEIFTDAERASILSASQSDTQVMLLVNRLTGAAFITYEDPEMELGLSLLVQAGLLTQERKEEIVQMMLPPALRG